MIDPGIYYLYQIIPNEKMEKVLAARFLVKDGNLHYLEDNFKHLNWEIPEGPITPATERVLKSFRYHPYLRLIHDDEIQQGHHLDLIPELELSDVGNDASPDHRFLLNGMGDHPIQIDIYKDQLYMDNKVVPEDVFAKILEGIREGIYHLTPIKITHDSEAVSDLGV